MKPIKTHRFNLGKYTISWFAVEACCDIPSQPDEKLTMMTAEVKDYHSFCIAAHEAEHADGIPDKIIHDKNGCPDHGGRHRFMWRIMQQLVSESKQKG